MNNQQKIDAYFAAFQQRIQSVQQRLAEPVANEVINATLDNFKNESFDGKPWPKRKSKKDQSRQLLVKSGRLRRSPRMIASSPMSVSVGSDLAYAAIHNYGGNISHPGRTAPLAFKTFTRGKRKGRTLFARNDSRATFARMSTSGPYDIPMPRRQFLGITKGLTENIKKVIRAEFHKEFRTNVNIRKR